MAVREDEAVAICPARVVGVVAQMAAPEHLGDLSHPQGHARVTGIRLLHGIHGEGSQHVDPVARVRDGCFQLCVHVGTSCMRADEPALPENKGNTSVTMSVRLATVASGLTRSSDPSL